MPTHISKTQRYASISVVRKSCKCHSTHLSCVVCFGNVLVSPALMHRLAEEGKSLVLLDERGRFKARLEGPISGNILLRQAQHQRAMDSTFALDFARSCIAGKIKNCRQILMRAGREAGDLADEQLLTRKADDLAASLRALAASMDLDALRGVEGEAARNYFGAMNSVIKSAYRSDFAFTGRSRRPPLDPLNALLSFLYSMLTNDCRSAIESVGLDPQLGFLHAVRPGRAALALDFVEEFRRWGSRGMRAGRGLNTLSNAAASGEVLGSPGMLRHDDLVGNLGAESHAARRDRPTQYRASQPAR